MSGISNNGGLSGAPAADTRPGDPIAADSGARTCVVVNRKASRANEDLAPALEVLAQAFGPPSILDFDSPARFTERLEAECAAGADRIVVAGGDGSIGSALDVLLRADKPLGILPLGTANDFARTLGIPGGLTDAAEIIVRRRTQRVDVGVVNDRYFLNAAGIGFSTDLHRELPSWAKRTLGPLAYPLGVARRWRRHRPFAAEIVGEELRLAMRVIQVTVANGRYYGGGMLAEQSADVDDGLLDLIVVLPSPWWRHIPSAIGLKRGVYSDRSPVVSERRSTFTIRTRRPHRVATDGEPRTSTPASFSVLPRALEVYVP